MWYFYLGTFDDELNNDSIKKRLNLAKKVLCIEKCVIDNDENAKQRTLIALDIARFCKIAQLILGIVLPSASRLKSNEVPQNYTFKRYEYPLSDPRVAMWLLREREDEYACGQKYKFRISMEGPDKNRWCWIIADSCEYQRIFV